MAVVDHVADLKLVIAVAKTYKAWYLATAAAQIAAVASSATADIDGRLTDFAKNRFGLTAGFVPPANESGVAAAIVLSQLGRTLNRNDLNINSPVEVLRGLRDYMLANSKVFLNRGVTHGAAAYGGSNDGTGLLVVHTADDWANTLQNVTDETLTFTCVKAADSGLEPGSETFEVRGELPARDILELAGSDFGGAARLLSSQSAATTQAVANANFSQAFSGSGLDKIPGWTIGTTAASLTAYTTEYYRTAEAGTSQSIKFTADDTLTQEMENLPTDGPVAFYVHYNRNGSCSSGTDIKIKVGGATATTVTTASSADSDWHAVGVCLWPRQWAGGRNLVVEIDNLAGGENILIGEVVVMPMTRIGGRWFAIKAGDVDWSVDDTATQDTSIAATGLTVDWLYRWFGVGDDQCPNMPASSSASAGYTDPV